MTRAEVAAHANAVHAECDGHALRVLGPEDHELYRKTMTPFLTTILLLKMAGKEAVFFEALATMNRIVEVSEKYNHVEVED